jgi:hypothetical protein
MRYLRTNTATRITVGPFLDKTDGITPEVALTVTSEKLTLMVDTAGVPTLVLDVAPTASGGANDMVHVTNDDAGYYDLELAAADVNYLGRACLSLNDVATHCPVFHEFMILPAIVYDALVLGTDVLQADVTQLLGTAWVTPAVAGTPDVTLTAAQLALIYARLGALDAGTAAAIANGTITLRSGHGISGLASAIVFLTGGTAAVGKSRIITYSGSGDVFNVDPAWNAVGETLPSGTITYVVMPAPPAPASTIPTVNAVKIGGTTQTGRDLGASVLLSSGSGTGQLDFTSGVVKANLAQILGTAITGTAAQLAAAFTKFFDKASPTGTVNSLPDAVAGASGGVAIVGSVVVADSLGAQAKLDVNAECDTAVAVVTALLPAALGADGFIKASLWGAMGTALTETAGRIAASIVKFFNQASPTGTINSLPDAVAGASGGVAIVGSLMTPSAATIASTVGAQAACEAAMLARSGADGAIKAGLEAVKGTALPAESVGGRDAAALGKLLDVATPVLTVASVNQTIDNPTASAIATAVGAQAAAEAALAARSGADGYVKVSVWGFLGTTITETAGLIAAAFSKFFNKATPTGTVNSLPDAVAGAASGVAIVGSTMGVDTAAIATAVAAKTPTSVS